MLQTVGWLVIVGSSVGVAVDASRLDARRGVLGGGLRDMGPAGWFFSCLLLWIVAVPCYLTVRGTLVRRRDALARLGQNQLRVARTPAWATAAAPPPPPGWYADPSGRPQWRWWSGDRWTDDLG